MTIGYRQWSKHQTYYVSALPKKKYPNYDWGYTTRIGGKDGMDKAIDLSPYWQRRFRKDCERVGSKAFFMRWEEHWPL